MYIMLYVYFIFIIKADSKPLSLFKSGWKGHLDGVFSSKLFRLWMFCRTVLCSIACVHRSPENLVKIQILIPPVWVGPEILHYWQAPGQCKGGGIPVFNEQHGYENHEDTQVQALWLQWWGERDLWWAKCLLQVNDSLKRSHWGLTNLRFNNYCGHQLLVSKLPKKKCTWPMIAGFQRERFYHTLGQVLWPVMSKPDCPCPAFLGLLLVAKSCPTLCDPMDCNLPGSSVMGFPRQEYWSGLPFPSLRDLPDPGIEPSSPALASGFLPPSHLGSPLFLRLPRNIKEVITEINTW